MIGGLASENDGIESHTDSLGRFLIMAGVDSYNQKALSLPGASIYWKVLGQ